MPDLDNSNDVLQADVVIVGGGPAGLCLARSLSGRQLKIVVVEQQPLAQLADPPNDGREIALTRRSAALLKELGLWQHIPEGDIAPLRDAQVLDGPSSFAMVIGHELGSASELGFLVSNHLIRRAACQAVHEAMARHNDITLLAGHRVSRVDMRDDHASVWLDGGLQVRAGLLVAADSRFSATRRAVGIDAHMHDFGKTMLVCCMAHQQPHGCVAWEWFDYGQTLALLPMNADPASGSPRSSVVITLPPEDVERLQRLDARAFDDEVSKRFAQRLGPMRLLGTRHAYPLVSVFPDRLVAPRFAAVGDAAVGMHPVTAHGFNFGLLSVQALTEEMARARHQGQDLGSLRWLLDYERRQKRATLPLFWLTRLIIEIYTRESPPAKLARKLLLHVGQRLTPLKKSIAHSLANG